MNKYLDYGSKVYGNVMRNPGFYSKLKVVMGNESCDLDSVICSLVYGYSIYKRMDETCRETVGVLSLLNIPSEDLPLKTEVTYFLKKCGISLELVQTRGDWSLLLDLHKINNAGALEIVLVDHHTLPLTDVDLQSAVIEIIDHRKRDPKWLWENVKDIDIRPVGSCSSLVAEKILDRYPDIVTPELAMLLLGPIVIDTVNLSQQAGRATELDHQVVKSLEEKVSIDRDGLLDELVRAKSNIDSLSTQQLFKKDMKIIGGIPVPGFPTLIRNISSRKNFEEDVILFMQLTSEVPVTVLLGLQVDNSNISRDLAICSNNKKVIDLILEALIKLKEPDLQLQEVCNHGISNMRLFQQNNIKATRKHIGPVLQNIAESINALARS